MASSELGTLVQHQLDVLNIDTSPEIQTFRVPAPANRGDMKTVRDAIQTSLGKLWISRRRIRTDALRLLREDDLL